MGDPVPPLRQHPRQSLYVPRRSYPGAYVPHRRPGRTDILDKRELEDVDEMLQVTENLGEK